MSILLELREKSNLTQEELAERSGVSVRTIQRIEAGKEPRGYTLKALAKALEVDQKELVSEDVEVVDRTNYTLLKIINLSSLPVTFIPFASILLPLLIMFFSKQFHPIAKQIVSVQIMWTISSAIVFMLSALSKNIFPNGSIFILVVMVLIVLSNICIILINTAGLDKNKSLRIKLPFSII
ncbi:helix-turn-helix domain-containing protein [Arcticibacter sp.]|uniref:helix-turn-helix domain-containing protein n=1 Tax=Arcticibacter sp. TaxID=1872630 RepID=UPI00388DAEC1